MGKNRNRSTKPATDSNVATAPAESKPVAKPAPAVKTPVDTAITSDMVPLRSRVNRSSGTRINLYGPANGGTTFPVQCVAHDTTVQHPSRKAAKATVYHPEAWCAGCATVVEAKAIAAKAAAEATKVAAETTK